MPEPSAIGRRACCITTVRLFRRGNPGIPGQAAVPGRDRLPKTTQEKGQGRSGEQLLVFQYKRKQYRQRLDRQYEQR